MVDNKAFIAVGRRKTSIARVKLTAGTGKISINGREAAEFFPIPRLLAAALQALQATGNIDKYDAAIRVRGGGINGQSGAVRLGMARALQHILPNLHTDLKKGGMLRRDPRMVERKKYGLRKARRGTQFSKR